MLFKPTIESMEENLLGIYKGRVKVLASRLNSKNAAVLGASSLIWTNE
jgi:glucokinase